MSLVLSTQNAIAAGRDTLVKEIPRLANRAEEKERTHDPREWQRAREMTEREEAAQPALLRAHEHFLLAALRIEIWKRFLRGSFVHGIKLEAAEHIEATHNLQAPDT